MRTHRNDWKNGSQAPPGEQPGCPGGWMQTATGRLIILPLILSGAWIFETFLFQGWPQVFLSPQPFGLLFYTLMACSFIGILVPVALMRQAFLHGDVNMHQLGLRPVRRTLLMAGLTLLIVWMAVVLQNPVGTDRMAFLSLYLLLLPTGIASAMVCFILAGTHVQAFVRERGALVAILAGTAVSAVLFALSLAAHFPNTLTSASFLRFLSAGALMALFFFAVRDVWAVSLVVTASFVWLTAGWLDPAQVFLQYPPVIAAAVLTAGILAALQWYLSRHYVTIVVPSRSSP